MRKEDLELLTVDIRDHLAFLEITEEYGNLLKVNNRDITELNSVVRDIRINIERFKVIVGRSFGV